MEGFSYLMMTNKTMKKDTNYMAESKWTPQLMYSCVFWSQAVISQFEPGSLVPLKCYIQCCYVEEKAHRFVFLFKLSRPKCWFLLKYKFDSHLIFKYKFDSHLLRRKCDQSAQQSQTITSLKTVSGFVLSSASTPKSCEGNHETPLWTLMG